MKLKTLVAERAALKVKANDALDKAIAAAGGKFTKEARDEQATFDAQIGDLDGLIEAEMIRAGRATADPAIPSVPDAGPLAVVATPARPAVAGEAPGLGRMLQAVFQVGRNPHAIANEGVRSTLFAAASGANESVDSEGAYLVQQQWGGTLMQSVYQTGLLAQRVRRQTIGDGFNGIKLNLIDETSRATGSRFGGIQVYWASEADAATASKPKLRRLELVPKKLIGLQYLTDELLADAAALEGYINEWFPQEFGFMLDDAILRGTGAGQPLGMLNAPALVTISKEAGQATKTIVATNLEKMYAALPAYSYSTAAWFFNVECWPQIFQLNHAIGTAGVPVFLPAGSLGAELAGAPQGRLLGLPLIPIEQASALGTVGDIVLADASRYLLADKGPIQTASSIHVKFLTDEMAFRWTLRVDGQPIPNSPITPYKGAQTLSPFVALQTR